MVAGSQRWPGRLVSRRQESGQFHCRHGSHGSANETQYVCHTSRSRSHGSLTPAQRSGIADHVGSIEVGKQADLLVLSKQLKVKKVFVRGEPFEPDES
ncbi:MAG: amidohydrolase family protein [Pirellulaceae bacterium]